MKRRPPVHWLSPWTLLRLLHASWTGWRHRTSDRAKPVVDEAEHRAATATRVQWFDFVSDTGDGFDATATVAWALAQPDLAVGAGELLPRADGVVHGGDMVYPAGTDRAYQDRFVGVMEAVLPTADPTPWFVGIPGNHDRYDGLQAWRRVMTSGASIGAWVTSQTDPWFARSLSPEWVLWGILGGLGEDADRQQEFFRREAETLRPGTSVILVVPAPTWSQAGRSDLDAVYGHITGLIESTGSSVRLWLTGDEHNYHRYVRDDGVQLVTAGGGGAFLSATHRLRDEVEWNGSTLKLQDSVYPSRDISERLRWTAPRMMFRNGSLPALMAGLYAAVGVLLTAIPGVAAPVSAALVTLVSTWSFTRSRTLRGLAVAIVHALMHGVAFGGLWMIGVEPASASITSFAVGGAIVGPLLVSGGLMVGSAVGVNDTELFSALQIDSYGCFLRCQIRDDASLVLYPIGIDAMVRDWNTTRRRIEPRAAPELRLIEDPVVLSAPT